MPKTVYFDCFSGASGDMVVGALLDLGLPLEELRTALGSLSVAYGGVSADRVVKSGVSATKFRVHPPDVAAVASSGRGRATADRHAHHSQEPGHDRSRQNSTESRSREAHSHQRHSLKEIAGFIERSALSGEGKDRAMHMFRRLAEAEAAVHAMPVERVHLHEVGALDSIVDIVGAVHGMEWLGSERVVASPLNVGSGTVKCEHGTLPVPAPATAILLAGASVYAGDVQAELVTPTGALIVTEYAESFGPLPAMRLESIGYGAGDRDIPGRPNVLRLLVGASEDPRTVESVALVECEIDDMSPQLFGPLMERLFTAGALDVFYCPVQMKKNRPGTLVTAIVPQDCREAVVGLLFAETTSIGVRYQDVRRECLAREVRTIETPLGPIRFKIASRDGRVLNAAPEFDDCARAAAARGLPIKDVQAIATKAWLDQTADARR